MLRAKLHQNVLLSFIFIQALSSVWAWEGSLSQPHLLLQVDTYQRPPIQGSCPPWAGGGGRVEGEDSNRSGPPSPPMSQPPNVPAPAAFQLGLQPRQELHAPQPELAGLVCKTPEGPTQHFLGALTPGQLISHITCKS